MRICVRGARMYCIMPSRYALGRSRQQREVISFAANRMWAPGVGCRGVLWEALLGVVPGCWGVGVSRMLSASSGENATWEGFGLSLVCRIGALAC